MSDPSVLDAPRDVREAFDVDAVAAWLAGQGVGLTGLPEVRQFPGGASNLTYLLRYPERDLILRRPPPGHKAKGAHDVAREYRLQAALKPVYPAVPDMVALCEDTSVLGSDFYVMARIEGIIPRARMPRGVDLSPEQARALCMAVLDKFVALHQVDHVAAGLAGFAKGTDYVQRQIEGWCRRYEGVPTWNTPKWTKVMRWLRDHQPPSGPTCIVHNDFRMDNLVLDPADPTHIIGVLDWELATLGDPLMDLGNSLAYWVQADDDRLSQSIRRQPTHLPGMLTRRQLVEAYAERTGVAVDDFRFYQIYGIFRLAVIVQQIYYRYHHGQTTNPAFKRFWVFNHYLRWRAGRALKGVL